LRKKITQYVKNKNARALEEQAQAKFKFTSRHETRSGKTLLKFQIKVNLPQQ